MQVRVRDIRSKMLNVLTHKGYNETDANFLVDIYLGGELQGHKSHGLASFPNFMNNNFSKLEEPKIMKETASLFMIDARSIQVLSLVEKQPMRLLNGLRKRPLVPPSLRICKAGYVPVQLLNILRNRAS